jgi:hypothetical protein
VLWMTVRCTAIEYLEANKPQHFALHVLREG